MNKKVTVAVAGLAVAALGFAGYVSYQQRYSASTIESDAIDKPDAGLSIKTVGSDGQTLLPNVRIGVIAADINNEAVREKLKVDGQYRAGIVGDSEMDVYGGNNKTQDVLTEEGANWFANQTDLSNLYMIKNTEGSYDYPDTSDLLHAHHGMFYYSEEEFQIFASQGSEFNFLTPVRIYASYQNVTVVKDLLELKKTGSAVADYTYTKGSLNEIIMKLPIMPANVTDAEPGLTFKVVDLNNNPIAGAKVQATLQASFNKPNDSAKNWYTADFNLLTTNDGLATITPEDLQQKFLEKKNDSKRVIRYERGIFVRYSCQYMSNIVSPLHALGTHKLTNSSQNNKSDFNFNFYFIGTGDDNKTIPSVAEVIFLNNQTPADAKQITFSIDNQKTSYLPGDEITAVFSFAEEGNPITITRTTKEAVQLNLSNAFDYSENFPVAQEQVASFTDTKDSGNYSYTFKLPADLKPGTYRLAGNIVNYPRVFPPIFITVVETPAAQ